MNAPLTFKPIGSAIKTRAMTLYIDLRDDLVVCEEQQIPIEVRYINVPGNPPRCDEPGRNDSIEIISIWGPRQPSGTHTDISFLFNDEMMQAIERQILGE